MKRANPLCLALLVCGLAPLIAAPAHAQNYQGQPVDITVFYPDLNTVAFDTGSRVIGPTGTDFGNVGGASAFVSPTQIIFTDRTSAGFTFSPAAFNGFGISETGPVVPSIAGVTVGPSTTVAGFTQGRLSTNSTTVFANFQGLTFTTADRVVLDVTFGPVITNPVPEAPTTASLGLLLALGAASVFARRRPRATP